MATNRDVQLTIKAKDEASRIIAKVTEALEKTGQEAGKAGKNINPLGDKFRRLTGEVDGLSRTLSKTKDQLAVKTQFDVATNALSRLTTEFGKNSTEIAKNSTELSDARAKLESQNSARDASRQSIEAESKALKDANKAVKSNTRELEKAKKASAEITEDISKREAKLSQYRANLDAATNSQRRATEEDRRAKTAAADLAATLKDVQDRRNAINSAMLGRKGLNQTATRAQARFTKDPTLENQQAATEALTARRAAAIQLATYDQAISRLKMLKDGADDTARSASDNLRRIDSTISAISRDMAKTDSLLSLNRKLEKAQSDIRTYSAALDAATADQTKLTASLAQTEIALQEQNAEIALNHNAVQQLEANSRRLEAAQRNLTGATETATSALREIENIAGKSGIDDLGADADATAAKIKRLEERLKNVSELSAAMSRYSDGAGTFTGKDDASRLRSLNTQLATAKEDAAKFKDEMQRLRTQIKTSDADTSELKVQMRGLSQALNAAESDARGMVQEIRKIGYESGSMRRGMVDAWRHGNNESRTALSLYQRLRGQVLSLIAAYGGLYGAISIIGGITQAYMTQEAALSRLGVVFEGNSQRMTTEFGWIRREAERLGIQFGVLADQYTKFAVATSTSGFSDESTRSIFTSISEAARVNKLSMEDIQGIYLATQQMISKGKIGAEELRQQMGERLPGAMNLMAQALGMTTAQLDKMMEQGQVLATEDTMTKFATRLDEVFGSQLPASLRTFTAEWGRLQNTIYQSRVLMGEGGVITALTNAMKDINEFANSREGTEFFLALGAAMGDVISYIPVLIENFETVVAILKLIIAIPLIQAVSKWVTSFGNIIGALATTTSTLFGARTGLRAFGAELAVANGAMTRTAAVARGLRAALAGLGPVFAGAFLVYEVYSYFKGWESGVDGIVEAQAQHKRIMDDILSQYDQAKDKTYSWKDAISEKSRAELASQITPNRQAFEASLGGLRAADNAQQAVAMGSGYGAPSSPIYGAADVAKRFGLSEGLAAQITSQWKAMMADLDNVTRDQLLQLQKNINKFALGIPEGAMRDDLLGIAKALQTTIDVGNNLSETGVAATAMGIALSDAENVIDRFPRTMEEMASGADGVTDATKKFADAFQTDYMDTLQQALDETKSFGDSLGTIDLTQSLTDPFDGGKRSINEMRTAMAVLRNAMPGIAQAFSDFAQDKNLEKLERRLSWMQRIPALASLFQQIMGDTREAALPEDLEDSSRYKAQLDTGQGWLIRSWEGLIHTAEQDFRESTGAPDKFRVGYGSDTITDPATGKSRTTQPGDTITTAQAEADLARRIGTYIDALTKEIGGERWASFNDEQQEVLLSLAHNFGSVPENVVKAIREGSTEEIADAIGSLAMPGKANYQRRIDESVIFRRGGAPSIEPYLDAEEERRKEAEKAAEDARKLAEKRTEDDSGLIADIELERLRVEGKEREAFIQEKLNDYVAKYGKLSEADLATQRERLGTLYDLQEQGTADEKRQEEIKKRQEEINRLESQRNSLLEMRKQYEEEGDTEKVAEVDAKLIGVNSQLTAAIDGFIAFWEASGDPNAAAGIAELEALRLGLRDVSKDAKITGKDINEQLAGGITDGLKDTWARMREGQSVFTSLRDGFRQFASDFLLKIGEMILQQTILNALQAGGGANGGAGGAIVSGLGKIVTGVFHTGKAPGAAPTMTRSVSPALFANAPHFHEGKLPGLRQGEMAAIIEEDEEILTSTDPNHSYNRGKNRGGSAAPAPMNVRITNLIDSGDMVSAGASTPAGEKAIFNSIKRNAPAIRRILGQSS